MKKLLVGVFFTLSLSLTAKASPVILYPYCYSNPSMGECSLSNTTGRPISCNFQVRGQTRNGSMPYAYQYVILYPGMYAWGRVFSNNPAIDPIIYTSATAFCNTLN